MIRHHPETALLVDYAAGSLPEPVALVIACHAQMCAECRKAVAQLETVGGALMAELEPAEVSEAGLAATLARLDEPEPEGLAPVSAPARGTEMADVPAPLRSYLDAGLSRQRWRWRGFGFSESPLTRRFAGYRASLYRMRPGATAPSHGHEGSEYTLVLQGGFTDDGAVYDAGDFALAQGAAAHVQVADPAEGCVCLVVHDAPVRLRGPLGPLAKLFQRF